MQGEAGQLRSPQSGLGVLMPTIEKMSDAMPVIKIVICAELVSRLRWRDWKEIRADAIKAAEGGVHLRYHVNLDTHPEQEKEGGVDVNR